MIIERLWNAVSVGTANLIESGAMTKCANRELSRVALEALDAYSELSHKDANIEDTMAHSTLIKRQRRRQRSSRASREIINDSSKTHPQSGLTINDYFFEHQRIRGFVNGSPIISTSNEVQKLNTLLTSQVEEYLQSTLKKETADGISSLIRNEMLSLDLWAAVQRGQGAYHKEHVHEGVLLSGVYYSAVPEGSAPLVLYKPMDLGQNHEMRADEDGENEKHIGPIEGRVIIFPPWLLHGVPPAESFANGRMARVSFAFNLRGVYGAGDPWDLMRI